MTANTVGVIAHLENPSVDEIRQLAGEAEAAGADWLGVADAFWWRDSWMLLAEAARATSTLTIGPLVTNPYLRHPFHTVSALATLQELAGPRVQLGVGAGGSEVSGAAGISRADAPSRIEALATLVRRVAAGGPLDETSGRRLDVPFAPVTVQVAGRGDRVLRAAGRCADRALLWAVPASDLLRSAGQIREGAAAGRAVGIDPEGPGLVWAPLVAHRPEDRDRARVIAAYGVLNAAPELRERWDIGDRLVEDIRSALVGGGAEAAAHLVPTHVVDDVVSPDPDVARHAGTARSIGAAHLAVPAHDVSLVRQHVAWARDVLASAAAQVHPTINTVT
jgi:5,10-methylenetetrahydromethanopterin reductase